MLDEFIFLFIVVSIFWVFSFNKDKIKYISHFCFNYLRICHQKIVPNRCSSRPTSRSLPLWLRGPILIFTVGQKMAKYKGGKYKKMIKIYNDLRCEWRRASHWALVAILVARTTASVLEGLPPHRGRPSPPSVVSLLPRKGSTSNKGALE